MQVKPGKPDQFCTLVVDGTIYPPITVSAYPTTWRVEIVDDPKHRDFGYIRQELKLLGSLEELHRCT